MPLPIMGRIVHRLTQQCLSMTKVLRQSSIANDQHCKKKQNIKPTRSLNPHRLNPHRLTSEYVYIYIYIYIHICIYNTGMPDERGGPPAAEDPGGLGLAEHSPLWGCAALTRADPYRLSYRCDFISAPCPRRPLLNMLKMGVGLHAKQTPGGIHTHGHTYLCGIAMLSLCRVTCWRLQISWFNTCLCCWEIGATYVHLYLSSLRQP